MTKSLAVAACAASVTMATSCGGGDGGGSATSASGTTRSGFLLNESIGKGEVVNFATGQVRQLPDYRSEHNWQASSAGGRYLVRSVFDRSVDLFETATFARIGGFDTSELTPARELFSSRVIPSSDGQYILAYYGDVSNKKITVYRPDGSVVQRGEDIEHSINPDLPPTISTNDASLRVSPDGNKLLLTLRTTLPDSRQPDEIRYLIDSLPREGGRLMPFTALPPAAADSILTSNHQGATWLPDGRSFVFYISPDHRDRCHHDFPGCFSSITRHWTSRSLAAATGFNGPDHDNALSLDPRVARHVALSRKPSAPDRASTGSALALISRQV